MNPYANSRVYGPYLRPDGRKHICIVFLDGSRKTISYPKYLVEVAIGRTLGDNEIVHHSNHDESDNRLENLTIVDRTTHSKVHARRLIRQDFLCPVCGVEFTLDGPQISNVLTNRLRNKSKSGPYCSKSCAGIGSSVQIEIKAEYYTLLSLSDESLKVDAAKTGEPLIDGNPVLGSTPSVETLHGTPELGEDKVRTTIGNEWSEENPLLVRA